MYTQGYPYMIQIYKGEGRMLFVPLIHHRGGNRIELGENVCIDESVDGKTIGIIILDSINKIRNSPVSCASPEVVAKNIAWENFSKYKTWVSFWKNNNYTLISFYEDGHYQIVSSKRSEKRKGNYGDVAKIIELMPEVSAEDIGKAVIDVFQAAEEYHKQNPTSNKKHTKKVQLLNGMELTMDEPADSHFIDIDDSGAAEIYQCYSYATSENAEPAAEFFIGIAPEIDCDLDIENVRASWEEYFGKADFFEMQETDYGIFKYRVEMCNKESHKISYLLKQEEDLLLECGMEVHSPNRRKKTDEKLVGLFEQFAISCRM